MIQGEIPTRTSSQIRTHAQKFFLRLREIVECKEEDLMSYICSKSAEFFVNKASKFARLGYEEGHHTEHLMVPRRSPVDAANPESGIAGKRRKPEPVTTGPTPTSTPPVQCPHPQPVYAPPVYVPPTSTAGYGPVYVPPGYAAVGGIQNNSALTQIETESRVLDQEFSKHSTELSAFCQKLTSDWVAGRMAAGCDPETAKCWSCLCAHGMALQHLVKQMMATHGKYMELVTLYKFQRMFSGFSEPKHADKFNFRRPDVGPKFAP